MISDMEWASKHKVELPDAVAIVACFDSDCIPCSQIPLPRKLIAHYIRHFWFGSLPPLVRKNGAFLSLEELEQLSDDERRLAVSKLPSDYDGYPWQRCKLGCHFWKDDSTGCMRHVQISHAGLNIQDVFEMPFVCSFRLPRQNGSSNVPEGPLTHCFMTFKSAKDLKAHKVATNHFQKKLVATGNADGAGQIIGPIVVPEPGDDAADDGNHLDLDELDIEDFDGNIDQRPLLVPITPPIPLIPAIQRKRKRSDDIDEVEVPQRRPPSRRGQDLKTTFLGMVDAIKADVNRNQTTVQSAVVEITRMVSTKSFVRSDAVEEFAKSIRRQVLASSTTSEGKIELYTSLLTELQSLNWE